VQQEAVDRLERRLLDVFVRAVYRIPRLEPDDRAPAALGECAPRIRWIERQFRKERRGAVEQPDIPTDQRVPLRVQLCHSGVLHVGRSVDELCLILFRVLEHVPHFEEAEDASIRTRERDGVAERRVVGGPQCDRQRPRQLAGEAHLVEHSQVVVATHEPGERTVRPGREQTQIRHAARIERDARQLGRPLEYSRGLVLVYHSLYERPAVRRNCGRSHRRHLESGVKNGVSGEW
jgi:hypothetical protein